MDRTGIALFHSVLLGILMAACLDLPAYDNDGAQKDLKEAYLIDAEQLKRDSDAEQHKASGNSPEVSFPDYPTVCNPFPIPTQPQGPTIVRNYAWYDDGFKLTVWRYPCDEDSSYIIFTIKPTSSAPPFICSSSIILVQNGQQNDDYKLTQDPVGNDDSQCGNVVVESSFALKAWSFASPNIDLQQSLDVYWDLGDNNQQFTVFAYDPNDYGIGGDPPPAELTNDVGVNGLFYDPANSGHGFDIIRHETGLIVYYYGHTATGERLWLISDNYMGNLEYSQEFRTDMFEISEGTFGHPNASPAKWGSLYLEFSNCDSGTATLNGDDGVLEIDFVRLVGLPGIGCE